MSELAGSDDKLRNALRLLLEWKDNNWIALEDELVRMLSVRDKWLQPFLLNSQISEEELREYLEQPFQNAIQLGSEQSVEPEELPQANYADDEWSVIYACFIVLRQAAVELKVLFAEAGRVDFAEVAALAQNVFDQNAGATAEAGFAVAEGIRHLLVDEFQDTSRVQYKLLGSILNEWPDHEGRSVFVVGDPMQSIYSFRNAEAELFHRTRESGLTLPTGEPYNFKLAQLSANFRTQPALVKRLNGIFAKIKENSDGAIQFVAAEPARESLSLIKGDGLHLHFDFMRSTRAGKPPEKAAAKAAANATHQKQIDEIVELCRKRQPLIDDAREHGRSFRIAILGRTKKVLAPIAAALSEAGITYRAADTEELAERAEVMDALALTRALLNPEDRVNWLGVLRAPWCGLPLDDLYTLVSADDSAIQNAPVPGLLEERAHLLTPASQSAVQRVLNAVHYASEFRAQNPSAALGTWIEAVWLKLGGAACVNEAQRANLDLLWTTLDKLTLGEADLLGPKLDAAVKKLKARPDPDSSSQAGVQLMTLHKSKGLEFEVVIVPELQAGTFKGNRDMLAFLERGTVDENEQPSEFLVAAKQPRGGERSNNKEWVDGVVRERERQEINRLFYVAATRAKEELYLFARIEYKTSKKGVMELNIPSDTLLDIASRGLRKRLTKNLLFTFRLKAARAASAPFNWLRSARLSQQVVARPHSTPGSVACLQISKLPHCPPIPPLHWERRCALNSTSVSAAALSRAYSAAPSTHSLKPSPRHASPSDLPDALNILSKQRPPLIAAMRAQGCSVAEASALMQKAESAVHTAVESPIGRWILAPHPFAASESKWTGVIGRELRQLRPDRLFLAGDAPLSDAQSASAPQWWIIDYKSAHLAAQFSEQELTELRRLYAPQLELYGRFLRELEGEESAINLGLFYPAAAQFDHWTINF